MKVRNHVTKDYVGTQYNRLKVTGEVFIDKRKYWTYHCNCGKDGHARPTQILNGVVKSCGCLRNEKSLQNILLAQAVGGGGPPTHGMTNTRPYRIWSGMKVRCKNPTSKDYEGYGGRGIKYEPSWESFECFWADMKNSYSDKLTLERKDNDKNYDVYNCIWATLKTQSHNKRKMCGPRGSIYIGVSKNNPRCLLPFRAGIVDPAGFRLTNSKFSDDLSAAIWYDNHAEAFYGHRPNKTEGINGNN